MTAVTERKTEIAFKESNAVLKAEPLLVDRPGFALRGTDGLRLRCHEGRPQRTLITRLAVGLVFDHAVGRQCLWRPLPHIRETTYQTSLFALLREVKEYCASALSAVALAWMLSPIVLSNSIDSLRYRPGLRNSSGSRQLSARQLQMVLESLRQKSGFLEMRFDESNFLTLGDRTRIAGGSAAVRELLIATIYGDSAFELENYDRSPYVAFARLGEGSIYERSLTKAKIAVRPLQIDFSDFGQLQGDNEVLAAFDHGFAVLHELCHGVLNLHDAVGDTIRLGSCDEHINRMRRELGLPERQHYNPRTQLMMMPGSRELTIRAELLFVRAGEGLEQGRNKRFYLRWDAEKVSVIKVAPSRRNGKAGDLLQ